MNRGNVAFCFLLIIFLFGCKPKQHYKMLYPVRINGMTGYISERGEMVLAPIYHNGGDFKEGLAFARADKGYGYINTEGEFVIPPVYDYAFDFSEGVARVYLNGKTFFIDKSGNKLFDADKYFQMSPFMNGFARVMTYKHHAGIISRTGKLIADTIYYKASFFNEGLAIIDSSNINDTTAGPSGVIDTTGKFVVPFIRCTSIGDYSEGLAYVENYKGKELDGKQVGKGVCGFIDKKGKLSFTLKLDPNTWISTPFHEGYASIHFTKTWYHLDDNMAIYTDSNGYEGFINTKGEVVLKNPSFEKVTGFSNHRAFAETDSGYVLLNRDMKVVSSKRFHKYFSWNKEYFYEDIGTDDPEKIFVHGLAFVLQDSSWGASAWGAIDTNGNYVIPPVFFRLVDVDSTGHYFVYTDKNGKYGIADFKGNIIVKPMLDFYVGYHEGWENHRGLFEGVIKNRFIYMDSIGKMIWSASALPSDTIVTYNTDVEEVGGYPVLGYVPEDSAKLAGQFGGFSIPHVIPVSAKFPANAVSVSIDCNEKGDVVKGEVKYNAFAAYVVNNTNKDTVLPRHEAGLFMKVQALDRMGQWIDIEESSCNDYVSVTLLSKHYWKFMVPIYEGWFKTKLRLAVELGKNSGRTRKTVTIYSEPYEGSINPAQFWNRKAVICF